MTLLLPALLACAPAEPVPPPAPRPAVAPDSAAPCARADAGCDTGVDPTAQDADGDGFTPLGGDCDDADPEVHPEAREVCNGRDDDCDGALDTDDPDADPYTCGWCPDPAGAEAAPYHFFTLNPCVLDPSISLCSDDPVAFPDTHDFGRRLHRIGWRTDLDAHRPELLLFLPPGPGNSNNQVLRWAAYAGFRTISLGWQNEFRIERCGDEPGCHESARHELAFGDDTNPWVDVWPSDSLVGRLETLLRHLVTTRPGEGWDRYWTEADGVIWANLVLMGWSQGASEAAWLARDLEVDGLVLISGPKEPVLDPVSQTLTVADWLEEPRVTPTCRQVAFYHREEALVGPPPGFDVCVSSFTALGLPEPVVDADATPSPYGDAAILNTGRTDFQQPWCDPHQAMAMDECMHRSLVAPYLYLMCAAADRDTCP